MTEESKTHYDVLIATPAFSFVPEYVTSLVETTKVLNEKGISYHLLHKSGSFIPSTREMVATDSYGHNWKTNEIGGGKYTYKKIFWIDSDIEWSTDDFMKLLNSELDVVSGLYVLDPVGTVAVNYPNERGVPTRVNKVEFLLHEDPVEVGGVGFGFVCMKHGVFESIPRPWFLIGRVQWSEDSEMRVNVGEDYSWCGKAQQAGYKIYVDPMVKVRHHKETVYEV